MQQQALPLVAKRFFAGENLSNGFSQLLGQGVFEHVAGGPALHHAHHVEIFVESGKGQIFMPGCSVVRSWPELTRQCLHS